MEHKAISGDGVKDWREGLPQDENLKKGLILGQSHQICREVPLPEPHLQQPLGVEGATRNEEILRVQGVIKPPPERAKDPVQNVMGL